MLNGFSGATVRHQGEPVRVARKAGPLHGIVGSPNGYNWSHDNSAVIAAGWIRQGANPAELATATGLDETVLTETLTQYARAVALRRDEDFGLAPATRAPLLPPLYAIPMRPAAAA